MTGRVLLVDDDLGVLEVVSYSLRSEGFEVETASDGPTALDRAMEDQYDLVILDVMLPGMPGTEVCRQLRAERRTVPILMLTAKDAELDRVLGLELGADDYVTKPFSQAELVSRVRALFRRRDYERESTDVVRQIGGLRLDFARHEVFVDGKQVRLTASEFKVLTLFASEPERVFSRHQVMEHLWESTYVGDEHAADVHISNLRRKIERDSSHPERIVTVRSFGYKLMPT
ncbi:MAG TPA: response regulator transcription factor [Actinomycetota bacterium]|nr:response regulator transcription factor [Actinomycetota bacterium]